MKVIIRKFLIYSFFSFLIISDLFAFINTGKVSGKITDAKTGAALAGVNVFIEDTPYGTATDEFGEYVILNIPPGDYSVKASYIGYATYKVSNVRVSLDRTTQQNFQLSEAVIEGEEVTVVADRPLIYKDLSLIHI